MRLSTKTIRLVRAERLILRAGKLTGTTGVRAKVLLLLGASWQAIRAAA